MFRYFVVDRSQEHFEMQYCLYTFLYNIVDYEESNLSIYILYIVASVIRYISILNIIINITLNRVIHVTQTHYQVACSEYNSYCM